MKKKLILSLVIIALVFSLSSCYLVGDLGDFYFGNTEGSQHGSGSPTVNLTGGDTNNITINTTESAEKLAANKALLSAVSVYSTFTRVSYGILTKTATSAGSGVIYKLDKNSGDAYIVTNYHVVYDAYCNTKNRISDDITVYLYGMEATKYAIKAKYVGGSMYYDLAVLKVENSDILMESAAVAASIEDANEISVLDAVIAIGNPAKRGLSATVGYVNVDSEIIALTMNESNSSTTVSLRVMRIDAAVNSGNSGGGLFNAQGKLVGIVNAKLSSENIDNIGYAIPVSVVRAVSDNIISYCDNTDRESLYALSPIFIEVGVSELYTRFNEESGKIIKSEKVIITSLNSDALAKTELMKGDAITAVAISEKSVRVTRDFHVNDFLLDVRVGDVVTFTVIRGGVTHNVSFTVTEELIVGYK
jgi:serine protease Do